MAIYTPNVGPLNGDDVGSAVATPDSWFAYDASKDSASVSLGTFTNSSTTIAGMIQTVILSSSRAVVLLIDTANSSYPTAVLLDISGTQAAVLDSIVIKSAAASSIRGAKVDSNYLVAQFHSTTGKARVIDTTGDTLALVGSEQSATYHDSAGLYGLSEFASDKVAIVFKSNAAEMSCSIIGVNTTSGALTYNTSVALSSGTVSTLCAVTVKKLSSTTLLAMYGVAASTIKDQAHTITVSGTTPTWGTLILDSTGYLASPQTQIISATISDDSSRVFIETIASYGGIAPLPVRNYSFSWSGGVFTEESENWVMAFGRMAYVETVNSVDYFLRWESDLMDAAITDFYAVLRPYKNTRTNKYFYPREDVETIESVITGTPAFLTTVDKISTSKVLAVYHRNTDHKYKAYIANL